ncbi:MAG: Galactokinase [Anaerolineales bacterium]|nr:Galactokinase [Anaerolineales bacterium]
MEYNTDMNRDLKQAFRERFHSEPTIPVRAPGRVNLIGEYTDYNEGFVLPMAINHEVRIALRPRADRRVAVVSLDLNERSEFDLDSLERGTGWSEYLKGVAHELQVTGYRLRGWEGVLTGDVPRGAGLSSSAALEMATARAFAEVSGFAWDAMQMAQIGQRAESAWVGVHCGIMDQAVSAAAKAGYAFFLDCRSLEYKHIPLPKKVSVVTLDTSTRRGLVDSAYNERREQCERAARFFGVKALRDVSVEEFEEKGKLRIENREFLDELAWKRARHVITENARVLQAVESMHNDDPVTLGKLFNESHASLCDDFEVTNDALNQIVEVAQRQPACYGARMTGAGFGGCAVALVRRESADEFAQAVGTEYRARSGMEAKVYVCQASEGASVIKE